MFDGLKPCGWYEAEDGPKEVKEKKAVIAMRANKDESKRSARKALMDKADEDLSHVWDLIQSDHGDDSQDDEDSKDRQDNEDSEDPQYGEDIRENKDDKHQTLNEDKAEVLKLLETAQLWNDILEKTTHAMMEYVNFVHNVIEEASIVLSASARFGFGIDNPGSFVETVSSMNLYSSFDTFQESLEKMTKSLAWEHLSLVQTGSDEIVKAAHRCRCLLHSTKHITRPEWSSSLNTFGNPPGDKALEKQQAWLSMVTLKLSAISAEVPKALLQAYQSTNSLLQASMTQWKTMKQLADTAPDDIQYYNDVERLGQMAWDKANKSMLDRTTYEDGILKVYKVAARESMVITIERREALSQLVEYLSDEIKDEIAMAAVAPTVNVTPNKQASQPKNTSSRKKFKDEALNVTPSKRPQPPSNTSSRKKPKATRSPVEIEEAEADLIKEHTVFKLPWQKGMASRRKETVLDGFFHVIERYDCAGFEHDDLRILTLKAIEQSPGITQLSVSNFIKQFDRLVYHTYTKMTGEDWKLYDGNVAAEPYVDEIDFDVKFARPLRRDSNEVVDRKMVADA